VRRDAAKIPNSSLREGIILARFHIAMASCTHHHNNSLLNTQHSYDDRWNDESMTPNDAVYNINIVYHAHSEIDTDLDFFQNIAPSYPLSHFVPVPPKPSPNPQLSPFHPFRPSNSNCLSPYSSPPWDVPAHNSPDTLEQSTFFPLPSALSTLSVATPTVNSRVSISQRAKHPCSFCGKLCTSRPRADTCLFNHIGIKPFACDGSCGVPGW
jgi:hypothetical protein